MAYLLSSFWPKIERQCYNTLPPPLYSSGFVISKIKKRVEGNTFRVGWRCMKQNRQKGIAEKTIANIGKYGRSDVLNAKGSVWTERRKMRNY